MAISLLGSGKFDRTKSEEVLQDILISKEEHYQQLAQGQLQALKDRAEHPSRHRLHSWSLNF